ncbi:FAD/NAD(P)-binding oxidoreductase [Micromonospora purpureochromogenes]|uniref:FAD/NAD(P)-binding oxidoreductase n=1 Tax=Micromonospora purpureochromogenes TaxID=47872 RepID=UPI00340E272A
MRRRSQKIAYLAADWWRRQGLLGATRIIMVLPTPTIFSQPDWAKSLDKIVADQGIEVRYESQLCEVDGDNRRAVILDNSSGTKETITFHLLHAVPPQSAPDWLKHGPLADPASPSATWRSTSTRSRVSAGRRCSPSATRPTWPRRKRVPRSANRRRWWWPTCSPPVGTRP